MAVWQRLLITIATILLASFIAGLLWSWIFGTSIPSYLGGAVGGLAALPTWEFLKRIGPPASRTVR